MKISYLSNSPLANAPANAVHVMNMCSCFAKNGHRVVLHAQGDKKKSPGIFFKKYGVDDNFDLQLVRMLRIKFLGAFLYGFLQAIVALKTIKPDLFYARCLYSAFFVVLFKRKLILELHEVPHNFVVNKLLWFMLRSSYLERIVVISDALRLDLSDSFPSMINKDVVVAHDGANVPEPSNFCLLYPQNINIGYAGGLRSGNGLDLILELAKSNPQYTFNIAGGSSVDVEEWKAKQKSENVYWYGRLSPADVSGFLAANDILLAPYQLGPKTGSGRDTSRWMSPLKIFEYMAVSRASIVSDYPVLREVLNNDVSFLIEPSDFDAWNDALNKLASNWSLRTVMGERAFTLLQARYTWRSRSSAVLAGL